MFKLGFFDKGTAINFSEDGLAKVLVNKTICFPFAVFEQL
jgi:hypothetical protein